MLVAGAALQQRVRCDERLHAAGQQAGRHQQGAGLEQPCAQEQPAVSRRSRNSEQAARLLCSHVH